MFWTWRQHKDCHTHTQYSIYYTIPVDILSREWGASTPAGNDVSPNNETGSLPLEPASFLSFRFVGYTPWFSRVNKLYPQIQNPFSKVCFLRNILIVRWCSYFVQEGAYANLAFPKPVNTLAWQRLMTEIEAFSAIADSHTLVRPIVSHRSGLDGRGLVMDR